MLIVPIGLLLAIFVSSATPWAISHFGNDLEVHQQAMEYLAVRWWSMPAILGQYVVLGWAIGRGATWVPFVMLVTANTLNAVLDIWFVLWLDLGVSGLAMGSIIADYVSLFIGLWAVSRIIKKQPNLGADRSTGHFDGFVHPVKRTLSRQNHSLTQAWWVRIQPLLVTNSHLLIRTLILLLVFLFFTYQGAESSSTVVAANAVLLSLLLLISNGLDGFAHAAETLIGQCSGKILGCVENAPPANTHLANHGHTGNRAIKYHYQDRWSAVLRTGLQTGLTAFAMSLVFLFLGDILLSWLNQQETVLALLNHLMPFLVLLPLIGAGGYWVDGILLGAQKTRVMRNIMLMTTLGIFIPGWYVLTQWLFLGNEGLWGALFVFLLARFIFAIPIIKRLKQG